MIITRTHTDPSSTQGFKCAGIITTDSNGVGTITVKGKDYSSKIIGISLTALNDTASAAKMYSGYIVSIAFSSTTSLTTITVQVNQLVDSGTGTTDISAYEGNVHYSLFVSERALPTDKSTNNTYKQDY